MGSKSKSLEILENLGFNTPNLLIRIPQFDSPGQKLASWLNLKVPTSPEYPEPRVSIRTNRDGETRTPHFPNVKESEADKIVADLARAGYEILIFEAIDPANCLLRGNLVRRPDQPVMSLEWMEGPGTVRDLEGLEGLRHLDMLLHGEGDAVSFPLDGIPPDIRSLAIQYFNTPYLAYKILEWSLYNQPIGKMKSPIICWEFREWL